MIDPSDLEGAIAIQVNGIVGEACRESFRWLCRREYGIDYAPPIFLMPGVELPVVPRIAGPRVCGTRKDARR